MPKYTAQSYLIHEGKIVKPSEEVELTEEQADNLGDKVKKKSGSRKKKKEEPQPEPEQEEETVTVSENAISGKAPEEGE